MSLHWNYGRMWHDTTRCDNTQTDTHTFYKLRIHIQRIWVRSIGIHSSAIWTCLWFLDMCWFTTTDWSWLIKIESYLRWLWSWAAWGTAFFSLWYLSYIKKITSYTWVKNLLTRYTVSIFLAPSGAQVVTM